MTLGSTLLCTNLAQGGDDGVSIPYGRTLTVQVSPVSTFPGEFEWSLVYFTDIQGLCGFESQTFFSDAGGAMPAPDIQQTITVETFGSGGSSYCKHKHTGH